MRLLPLAFISSLAAPVAASDLVLDWPVDCTLGDSCQIQQYVDRALGPATQDFTCNPLTYDGHKGTDIALPYLSDMNAGVTVFAAADGTVVGSRDGMEDRYSTGPGDPAIEGRECGNGVLLRHGEGWETQYCHMKRGSILVQSGDRVTAGTPLGEIGLSGNTQFPHLHFSVRKDGKTVDPFGPRMEQNCGTDIGAPLWADDITYQAGGFLGSGFADHVPKFAAIKAGTADQAPLPAGSGAVVFWAYAFGSRSGDQLMLRIDGPDGPVLEQTERLEKTQAQLFRAAGKRIRGSGLQPGRYTATATLLRDGEVIDDHRQDMTVE
ncbi:M23 family peptidase [Phaeobacter inhibens]|uniref:M23 family metallopeptidase n=1 Tax=Phaeobacter inhibens TaxID=221822 RepID=UPI000160DC65|nr:M23 family metallopeptidase [Phaeobacter inhibens]AFO88305.1 putative peptidase, M23 family [Phaeobacter inhibens 2.10]AXT43057.1 M23 family peptidase [Phaeobacter inhibens]